MATKKRRRRAVGLMSLVDVVFLLLIFFLVVSIFVNSEQNEYALFVRTPENIEGEADILIQITDDGRFFFMDDDYFLKMDSFMGKKVYNPRKWSQYGDTGRGGKLKSLLQKMYMGKSYYGSGAAQKRIPGSLQPFDKVGIKTKIFEKVKTTAAANAKTNLISTYMILVRCPANVPYGDALLVINAIKQAGEGAQYFQYGISGGSMEDFSKRGGLIFAKLKDDPDQMGMVITFDDGKAVTQ